MAITSGFYNSFNGDRRYNSEQMSDIFSGVINDGVFANIGNTFQVKADTGNGITVDTGKAWFDSKWVKNDSLLPITADTSEILLDRYDAVVIEVNTSESVRNGDIKMVKGTPSSTPQYPTLTNTIDVHQYPIAYILRPAGSSSISQSNITNMVGTSSCPYITGILEVRNIDNIIAQWKAEWTEWFNSQTVEGTEDLTNWIDNEKQRFEAWFAELEVILDGDVASNLAAQILELQQYIDDLKRYSAIYSELQDSNGEQILDNLGNPIQASTVFGGSSSGGGENINIEIIPVSYVDSLFNTTD